MSRAERRRNQKALKNLAQKIRKNPGAHRVEIEKLMKAGLIPDRRSWVTKVGAWVSDLLNRTA